MAKRIIKETLLDGSIQFRVEEEISSIPFFGKKSSKWITCTYRSIESGDIFTPIFYTYDEAVNFCGKDLQVKTSEILEK